MEGYIWKIETGGCPIIPQSKHFSEAQDFSPTRKIIEKDNTVSKKQLSDSPTVPIFLEDAESDETPKMLKRAEWAEIKRYFEKEVKKLAR